MGIGLFEAATKWAEMVGGLVGSFEAVTSRQEVVVEQENGVSVLAFQPGHPLPCFRPVDLRHTTLGPTRFEAITLEIVINELVRGSGGCREEAAVQEVFDVLDAVDHVGRSTCVGTGRVVGPAGDDVAEREGHPIPEQRFFGTLGTGEVSV